MSKLLLVAPAFVFPLVYLVSKLFGHRIPSAIDAFKLSDDEAFTTLVVMGISEHSAVLWTPLMRIALVEGRDQGAALTLAIAYSLFMATFLAKNFSWGFLLQLLMTGSVFGPRVSDFGSPRFVCFVSHGQECRRLVRRIVARDTRRRVGRTNRAMDPLAEHRVRPYCHVHRRNGAHQWHRRLLVSGNSGIGRHSQLVRLKFTRGVRGPRG
jgi:hypothetical protein